MKYGAYLYKKLLNHSSKNPNKDFFIDLDLKRNISYSKFKNSIDSLEIFLEGKDTILFTSKEGFYSALLWICSLSFGHRLIPISKDTTKDTINELIDFFNPSVFITDINYNLKNIDVINTSQLEKIINKKIPTSPVPKGGGTVCLTTSGSTGKPKKILLTEDKIVNTALNVIEVHHSDDNDICFNTLFFFHINAPVIALSSTLISGGTIVNSSKFSKSKFWGIIKKYNITWINSVPTIINILLETTLDSPIKSLKFIRTGSAPIPVKNIIKFEEKFNIPIIETYGLSEAASQIVANSIDNRKIGSVGIPRGVELLIIDKNDKGIIKLKNGEKGEITIKGDSVINSYLEDVSQDSFVCGYFKTGDIGYIDPDGFVYITGRKKDIIICNGENIYPKEIEEMILKHNDIKEVVVMGKQDKIKGEDIVAFIVSNTPDFSLDIFIKWLSSKLPSNNIPKEYLILDEIPKMKNYKIDKLILKEMINENYRR